MTKHNAANERIKREYFSYLKAARGRDEATIDRVAASLASFEESTRHKGFDRFHRQQAVAFRNALASRVNARTGKPLSKATILSTLGDLRAFFVWLMREPGFKSRIAYSDADYFNLSDNDVAIARAKREKRVPTIAQVEHVLTAMATTTPLHRRDRALIAFAAVTGARVDALASFQLEHVDTVSGHVDQDARDVRTKFRKTFRTHFMPFVAGAEVIVGEWIDELKRDHLWGPADPLFPSTAVGLGADGGFTAMGVSRTGWASTGPIRDIFRRAFEGAGLPYFNPHSFRDMLIHYGMTLSLTPEAMKALSQNLGHEGVLTTFTSYGHVPTHRQGTLIRSLGANVAAAPMTDDRALMAALAARLGASAATALPSGPTAR